LAGTHQRVIILSRDKITALKTLLQPNMSEIFSEVIIIAFWGALTFGLADAHQKGYHLVSDKITAFMTVSNLVATR
jgi:hypothetical protein